MWPSGSMYGRRVSVHCFMTIFGIPFGPGVLNGFSLSIACLISAVVIGVNSKALGGNSKLCWMLLLLVLVAGKKVLKSVLALSLLLFAVQMVLSSLLVFRFGTLALPPSIGSPNAYLCAVQIVFLSILFKKSSQFSHFDFLILLEYRFQASWYFLCASCVQSSLFL